MQKLDCKIEVASLKILAGVLAMTPLHGERRQQISLLMMVCDKSNVLCQLIPRNKLFVHFCYNYYQ